MCRFRRDRAKKIRATLQRSEVGGEESHNEALAIVANPAIEQVMERRAVMGG